LHKYFDSNCVVTCHNVIPQSAQPCYELSCPPTIEELVTWTQTGQTSKI